MDKKDLESKKLPDLKEIAKALGLSNFETLKKAELIDQIIKGETPKAKPAKAKVTKEVSVKVDKKIVAPASVEEKKVEEIVPVADNAADKPKRARTIKKVIISGKYLKNYLDQVFITQKYGH